jgi:hypothetical protein
VVLKRRMLALIEAEGVSQVATKGDKIAHPLIAKFTALMVRVDAGFSKFRLTGDGKGHLFVAPPKELSPFEKLQQQAPARRG